MGLARNVESTYLNGKALFYEDINHQKTITVRKNLDSLINESINIPHRSMKGILMLFCETHAGGA